MKNIDKIPPVNQGGINSGFDMLIDLYKELINTPRHVLFWNLVGFIGQAILIYLSVELWMIIQFFLFIILIGYAADGDDSNLVAQSIATYILIFIVVLSFSVYNILKKPVKSLVNLFYKFNDWLDKK